MANVTDTLPQGISDQEKSLQIPLSETSSESEVSIGHTDVTDPDTPASSEDDKLWAELVSGQKKMVVDGITISNPRLISVDGHRNTTEVPATKIGVDETGHGYPLTEEQSAPPSTMPVTPSEFAIKGEATVFGLTLPATLSTLKGSKAPGTNERIDLPSPLTVGNLIPKFAGSTANDIALTNAHLTYHSYSRGDSKPPGLRLKTDLELSGALEPVSKVLQTVFGLNKEALTFNGFISESCDMAKSLESTGLQLSESLLKLEVKLGQIIEITDLTINLTITKAQEELACDFAYAFLGGANVTVPSSVVPMRVNWNLAVAPGGTYGLVLVMKDSTWANVMGVQGLKVENVQFNATWTEGQALDTLDLGISAALTLRGGTIGLKGQFSKVAWLLEGTLENVDLNMLEEIYEEIFGYKLNPINDTHDMTFSTLRLTVSSNGLVLTGQATVNGYTSASANITLGTAGLEIQGSVENVRLDEVTIENASLDVFIGSSEGSGLGRPFRVAVAGRVKWGSLEFDAGLYIDKIPGEASQWTVYGDMEGSMALSTLVPGIASSGWLDLGINSVAFVASSHDVAPDQVPNKFKYPVKKGVQMCASIVEPIKAVNAATRTNAGGLILSVVSEDKSLSIGIKTPAETTIKFSKNIISKSISLEIVVSEDPHVKISADLLVQTANQDALTLTLDMEAGETSASAKATMDGMWHNPFGISPKLSIGDLLLEISIIYEEFFETGIPKEVKFGGDMDIGGAHGVVLVNLSEDPKQELIAATVSNLDLSSLFSFGSQVSALTVAPPPAHNDILKFIKASLYCTSDGVTIDDITYPPGASFKCDMDIFSHNANVEVTVGKLIKIYGTIEPFKLGPVTVTGFKTPSAMVDMEFGPDNNRISLDGAIDILTLTEGVNVNIILAPTPKFTFETTMTFSDLLTYTLTGTMEGELNGTNTGELDFTVEAKMEQHIVQYIIAQAAAHFETAYQAAQLGFEAKEVQISAQEAQFSADLDKAKKEVESLKAAWDAKNNAVNKSYADKKASLDAEHVALQGKVNDAKNKFDAAVVKVENDLGQVKADMAAKVKAAEVAIATAAKNADADIERLKKDVANRQAAVDKTYGDVEGSIQAANNNLNKALAAVNAKQQQINDMNMQLSKASFFNKIRLHLDMTELEVEKKVEDAALWVAQKAVQAGNSLINDAYNAAKNALAAAQGVLTAGEASINATAKYLQADLDHVNVLADIAINKAEADLEFVQKSGAEKLFFDKVQKGLQGFENALQSAMADVEKAMQTLVNSAEYLAYIAAIAGLNGLQANIKNLDPARLALTVAKDVDDEVHKVVEEALKAGGNFLDVRTVDIKGSLVGLVKGTASLDATVVAVLMGKEETFTVDFNLGGVEMFFEGLWDKVWAKLKL